METSVNVVGCSAVQPIQIEGPRRRKIATLCLTAAIGGLLASCSNASSSAESTVAPMTSPHLSSSGEVCHQTFVLQGMFDSPSSQNPTAAVSEFLRTGSMVASGHPIVNPVSEGFPSGGWEETSSTASQATFSSHGSLLVLTKSGSGTWQVYRGSSTKC